MSSAGLVLRNRPDGPEREHEVPRLGYFRMIGLEYQRLPADAGCGQLRLVASRPILRIPPDPFGSIGHRVFERAIRRD